jgi:alpha-tubulin suppressor-like RCC1 family protein
MNILHFCNRSILLLFLALAPLTIVWGQVIGGNNHFLGTCTDSLPIAWGWNRNGQLGNGTLQISSSYVQVGGGLGQVIQVACGVQHSIALQRDSTVWTWGWNDSGQLGDGSRLDRSLPFQLPLTQIVMIAAGGDHSMALAADSTVWTWGNNAAGQLGIGNNDDTLVPVQIAGLDSVIAIAAGGYFSLALKSDGTLWAWGENNSGQLGDGTPSPFRNTPGLVLGLDNVAQITAGQEFAMAIRTDSTLWTWGANNHGQLGDGTTSNRSLPFELVSMHPAVKFDAGWYHSLVRKADDSIWAFGQNDFGQLGLGDTVRRLTPTPAPSLTGAKQLVGGIRLSFFLMPDNQLLACGLNIAGSMGLCIVDTFPHATPAPALGYCLALDAVADPVRTNHFRPSSSSGEDWVAGELKSSILMPDGKVMWLFGKSSLASPMIGNTIPCNDSIFNCIVVQDNDTLTQLTTYLASPPGDRSYFQTTTPNTTHFTPGHGYIKGDTAMVFLRECQGDSFVGTSVGRVGITTMDLLDIGRPSPAVQRISFGNGVIVDSVGGHVYVFGSMDSVFVVDSISYRLRLPFLARYPHQSVYAPWQYWSGSGWNSSQWAATPISRFMVSDNYAAFKRDSAYHIVSEEVGFQSETCGADKNFLVYHSPSITGMYADPMIFYTAQDSIEQEPLLTFDTYTHPWLSTCDSLLVTYNRSDMGDTLSPNACPGQCLRTGRRHVDAWRPQFIRVPYKALDIFTSDTVTAAFTVTVQGNTVQFLNQSQGANSFIWDFGDGTTDSVHPIHTFTTSWPQTVTLYAIGCGDTAVYVLTVVGNHPTIEESLSAEVFPNPNAGTFTVRLGGISRQDIHVYLLNMYGQVVLSHHVARTVESFEKEFELNERGVFLLCVKGDHAATYQKIIVW